MTTANVIPLSAQVAADLARQHALPMCTVLTPELGSRLQAVNAMTRTLRAAGIRIEHVVVLDSTVFIAPESSDLLASLFRGKWRGASWTTVGKHTKNMVTLDGVRVAWMTPVKEQDQ
ncbi:hypothetical protein [Zestomonas carbonaria]|uniref:Uncharacterized protein n=1 Tax=Zestomonas carbonaria TaxID=2762745 RepID=A0A7U7ELL3_9GAMM|nr:hypothetical protein [Pseudomonas carbonaria]CAD5107205.1 hypothetical protein PSEWESI4_01476 [Pseudomonas carbonaria]